MQKNGAPGKNGMGWGRGPYPTWANPKGPNPTNLKRSVRIFHFFFINRCQSTRSRDFEYILLVVCSLGEIGKHSRFKICAFLVIGSNPIVSNAIIRSLLNSCFRSMIFKDQNIETEKVHNYFRRYKNPSFGYTAKVISYQIDLKSAVVDLIFKCFIEDVVVGMIKNQGNEDTR